MGRRRVAPAALPAPSRVDLYGFERPEDFDYAAYDEFLSAYLAVLTRRALKWSRLLRGDGGLSRTATGERGASAAPRAAGPMYTATLGSPETPPWGDPPVGFGRAAGRGLSHLAVSLRPSLKVGKVHPPLRAAAEHTGHSPVGTSEDRAFRTEAAPRAWDKRISYLRAGMGQDPASQEPNRPLPSSFPQGCLSSTGLS